MAFLKQAKTEDEIRKLTISNVRKAYNELAQDYNKIIDGDLIRCSKCGEFLSRRSFYQNKNNATGVFHECKKCILKDATDYDKKTDTYIDNKEKTKHMLMLMDLPFDEKFYDSLIENINNDVAERQYGTAWSKYITAVSSLPQYQGLSWKDSEFVIGSEFDDDYEIKENQKTIKNAKKRFGPGYSNEDYMFLENEYQDWITRYECENKTQESIFERLAFKKWEIMKATRNGQPTKDLDKTYTDLLSSANLLPRQNVGNAATDSLTFGQLIEKWEQEEPIPEASEEFKDIDGIVKYIDVFFKGHLAKMMGLKNGYSHQYDNYMKQYTVTKPEYNEDEGSEAIFDALFGTEVE